MSKIQYKTVCTICRLDFQYDKMLCRALDNKVIELNHSRICRECIKKRNKSKISNMNFWVSNGRICRYRIL